jgi:hypothetical protein
LEYIFGLLFFFFFSFIVLDYYITNNTFNDIVISILITLYNITCACFFIQGNIFQTKNIFYFKKPYFICIILNLMDLNIIKVEPYNIRTTKVIINAQKKTCLFKQTNFISTSPFTSTSQMLKHANESHNIFINKFHQT